MLDEFDRTHKAFSFQHQHEHNLVTGRGSTLTLNNLESVQSRLAAVRAAMADAEEMAVAEPDQSLVPGRLQALRNALPAVSTELLPAKGKS